METKTLTQTDLNQFIGTVNYYRHWSGLLYTDGIEFLAEKAGAYWLIDAIASHQRGNALKCPFQVWELKVNNRKGVLTMKEDTNQPARKRQAIPYTDFPMESIKLYYVDGVLMLPSEY